MRTSFKTVKLSVYGGQKYERFWWFSLTQLRGKSAKTKPLLRKSLP
jgi:hypothetical protein